jgi:uncharacterized protein (DUF302 family)
MSYYFSKKIEVSFDKAVSLVTGALKEKGFGVLTEIDVRATMKKKLDLDFRDYMILGACNPQYASRALEMEDEIGTMLPCNVVVQQLGGGVVEVAAINPKASMMAVDNSELAEVADTVGKLLEEIIEDL